MAGLKYQIQIPGKTFFFGEYAALLGGEALMISSKPGFEMEFEQVQDPWPNPFHLKSPAGRFYSKNEEYFFNWRVQFTDYYQGRGGFGASTAQFLGLALFKRYFENPDPHILKMNFKDTIKSIWDDYLLINDHPESAVDYLEALSHLPSGYDLWAQSMGSMVRVSRQINSNFTKSEDLKSLDLFLNEEVHFAIEPVSWPFSQLEWLLVPTGFKVPTHEHLKTLKTASFANLKAQATLLMKDFIDKKQSEFLVRLNKWNRELESLGLIHPNTAKILKALRSHSEVLFTKGCGALGADVILLVFAKNDQTRIELVLKKIGLNEAYGIKDVWEQKVQVQIC